MRTRAFGICAAGVLIAVALTGCGGDGLDDTSDESRHAGSTTAIDSASAEVRDRAYTAVYRFSGSVDTRTGDFQLGPAVRTFESASASQTGLRTARSASYCDMRIVQDGVPGTGPVDTLELYTPDDSIASSLPGESVPAACTGDGIASGLFLIDGVFCAEIILESFFTEDLANVYAVIDSFGGDFATNGPYLFPQGSGAEAPVGEGAPEGELGIWSYGAVVAPDTPVSRVWTFRNQSAAAYSFTGSVYAEYEEVCGDDVDNDCDGRVDEGCGEFALGVACVDDGDCASAACDDVTNRCAPGTCDNAVRDGAETDVDCGGGCPACALGDGCAVGSDCASGVCRLVGVDRICRATANPDAAGELVVSEVMADPGVGQAEWFELYNRGDAPLDLEGCLVLDGPNERAVVGSHVVEAGTYFVITEDAASPAVAGLDASDFAVVPLALNNAADSVGLSCNGTVIDRLEWDVSEVDVITTARSAQLDARTLTAAGNDDALNLCDSTTAYGSFFGTPGSANVACEDFEIGFCRYQFPTARPSSSPAGTTFAVYGRVYVEGLTDADRSNNPARRLIAEAGLGPAASDPATAAGWTWSALAPNDPYTAPDTPLERNNDEYFGTVDVPDDVGTTFDSAIRFSGDAGGTWVYCDRDGSTDGYEIAEAPQLLVTAPVGTPDAVGEILITEAMINGAGAVEDSEFIEVYNAAAGALDLRGCVLRESVDHDLTASLVLEPGEYGVIGVSSVVADNGDLPYDLLLPDLAISNSGEAIALRCDGVEIDAVTFPGGVDVDGVSHQLHPDHFDAARNSATEVFDSTTVLTYWCNTPRVDSYGSVGAVSLYGTPGAANVECVDVSYCRLDTPGELIGVASSSSHAVRGQVYAEGVTDQSTGVEAHHMVRAEVGVGSDGTDPATHASWSWSTASPVAGWNGSAVGEPNNDGYTGSITAPAAESEERDYAYRFSGDRGVTWTYCDRVVGASNASADGYQVANAGRLTTPSTWSIGWCRLGGTNPHTGDAGTTHDVYVEAFIPGFTDLTPGAPDSQPAGVQVQFGYGSDGSAVATWSWDTATINYGNGNNDGWRYDFEIPQADAVAGTATSRWAFRISGDGGGTWQYCDYDAADFPAFAAADGGTVTSRTWAVGWGYHQWPTATQTVDPGASATYYGRVLVGGLTDRSASVDANANLVAQIGYGETDTDPGSHASWQWTVASPTPGYNHFAGEVNYDEYRGVLEPSRTGTWSVAWRFSGDGGQTWFYADRGGRWDGGGQMPSLVVSQPSLFFSEYVEGSSWNKAVEIYVAQGSGVDLNGLGCSVRLYANGSPTPTATTALATTSLGAGDVFVFCADNPQNTVPGCDQRGTAARFNGDDAVELYCTSLGTLDVIGQIGVDPGSQWGSGLASTQDNTIRRSCAVVSGDSNGLDAFDPAAEWTGFASNTFGDVGQHVCP